MLVTGVGGAAGIAVIRGLSVAGVEIHAADCDPLATGLHLVDSERRLVLPKGKDPSFVGALIAEATGRGVDVVIPTVDEELLPVAQAVAEFEARGVKVMASGQRSLATCLDKQALLAAAGADVACPRSEPFDEAFDSSGWEFPVVMKPRTGRGGAGVELITDCGGLEAIGRDAELLVQEHLPGEEYSVDVLVDSRGRTVACVPRVRIRVDSGVATVTRTFRDPDLQSAADRAAQAAGLRGVANVQFRRDADGIAKLLEINPRFPGTLAVTIASGVNLPALALSDCLGDELPADAGEFTETGMVRMLSDTVVAAEEIGLLEVAAAID